jgi:hypothetical protein
MDLLDRVLVPASDLLSRVDTILTACGGPGDHPVWHEIARTGTLPSTALAEIAALAPDDIRASAAELARIASGLRTDQVPVRLDSRGLLADGFAAAWRGLSGQVAADADAASGGDPGSLADRVAGTGAQLDEVAAWASAARRDLAGELGACLGSSEAVQIRASGGEPDAAAIRAAADVAAYVLASVSRSVDEGWARFARGSGLDTEISVTTTVIAEPQIATHIELR